MTYLRSLLLCLALCLGGILPGQAQDTTQASSCTKAVIYDAATAGSTQLVAAGSVIQICGYVFLANEASNVELLYGTGTTCSTGSKKITPAFELAAHASIVDPSPFFRGMSAPSGTALCINSSNGVAVQAIIYYSQGPS